MLQLFASMQSFCAGLEKVLNSAFMRIRDLFVAMDTEGKGCLDADLMEKAIYKLGLGDEFEVMKNDIVLHKNKIH